MVELRDRLIGKLRELGGGRRGDNGDRGPSTARFSFESVRSRRYRVMYDGMSDEVSERRGWDERGAIAIAGGTAEWRRELDFWGS